MLTRAYRLLTCADLGYAEALLGHATHSVTTRYIHHIDAALVAAADSVSRRIVVAMNGDAAELVMLSQRAHAA